MPFHVRYSIEICFLLLCSVVDCYIILKLWKDELSTLLICNEERVAEAFGSCDVPALIRHNKVATDAFRLSNGYAGLREALASEDLRFQRYVASALLFPATSC